MCRLIACAAALVLLCPSFGLAQGTLGRARLATLGQPASNSNSANGDGQWFHLGDFDDSNALLVLAASAVIVPTAPLWAPAALLDDNVLAPGYFPAHPYAIDRVHYLHPGEVLPQDNDKSIFDPEYLKNWAVRLSLENGNDFNGLNRLGGIFAVDTASRLGAQTSWNYYAERLTSGHTDETVIGDINGTIRFAQSDWMLMHVGAGARIMADRYGTRGGFNFLYSADAFPIDPVVFSTSVDLGNLDSAFVVHARATLGWQIDRFELFAGYDFLRIGSANLQGPMAGLRMWF